jgi:hypothetical protein
MLTTHIQPTRTGRIRIARRAAGYFSILIVLYVLVYVLVPWFMRTLPPCDAALWWLRGEVAATAIFVVAIGVFLLAQSWRAMREGQWPSPGTDVLIRVKVLRGRQLWLLAANALAYWLIVVWTTGMAAPLLLPYLIHGTNACNA